MPICAEQSNRDEHYSGTVRLHKLLSVALIRTVMKNPFKHGSYDGYPTMAIRLRVLIKTCSLLIDRASVSYDHEKETDCRSW